MLSNPSKDIGKKELDIYLRELGKEYRKLAGKKNPAEIVLIGGGAILANYNFRTSTTDVDAIIHAASAMKEAINRVGDKYYLANRWLNEDFLRTVSYSPKIEEFSQFYRQYSNVLQVRTIKAEYIIAMKLRAGRKYKNDFSDVIGVLMEHEEKNEHISYGDIDRAVINLYGSWNAITEEAKTFLKDVLSCKDLAERYAELRGSEGEMGLLLQGFEVDYSGVLNQSNVNDILDILRQRKAEQKIAEKGETYESDE